MEIIGIHRYSYGTHVIAQSTVVLLVLLLACSYKQIWPYQVYLCWGQIKQACGTCNVWQRSLAAFPGLC